jgi:hypothetical protein
MLRAALARQRRHGVTGGLSEEVRGPAEHLIGVLAAASAETEYDPRARCRGPASKPSSMCRVIALKKGSTASSRSSQAASVGSP